MTGSPAGATVCWFAGLTTLDVIHRAAAPPARDAKITATRQDVAAGGPAANAAVTAAALGVRAVLITALGQGPVAAAARADLEAHGVEILDTAGVPGRGSVLDSAGAEFRLAVSAVLVDEHTGERSVVSPDGALAVAPAPRPEALAALPHPDVVLLDGHHPQIARAVLAVVAASIPRPRLVLDCGRWRPVFTELLPRADVAALSDDFRFPEPSGIARTATAPTTAEAALATGARAVVITHGPDPVEWHTATGDGDGDEQSTELPRATTAAAGHTVTSGTVAVPSVQAADTLGAGDAFHGALAVAVAHRRTLPEAVEHAALVASRRVAVVGPREWLATIRRPS